MVFDIKKRLRAFLRDPPDTTREELPESETEWYSVLSEEQKEEERETWTLKEMSVQLIEEARATVSLMSKWVPDEKTLSEVAKLLPEDKKELINSPELSELITEIQDKYVSQPFLTKYFERLHSFQEDVANLEKDDHIMHYLEVSTMASQLAQIMVISTQALIAKAYAFRLKELEKTKEPAAEQPNWTTWGGVTGEG